VNYRHAFHAGNHTEIFKHAVLAQLIGALHRKPKPAFLLDTHAGPGRYDLASQEAMRTQEFADGIGLIWKYRGTALSPYLSVVRAENVDTLRYYPGSPRIISALMREHDRAAFCELHPEDYPLLKQLFRGSRSIATHMRDGYEAMTALVPPLERRGLVFIDPPYEQHDEVEVLTSQVLKSFAKWPTGVYAAWYPIKSGREGSCLKRAVQERYIESSLAIEFIPFRIDGARLAGSGLVILNAPWEFELLLRSICTELVDALGNSYEGHWSIEWLITPK
jgi:23S rRNA (adenine2030-N6)-methyltransferase